MHLESLDHEPPQQSKMKDRFGKGKDTEPVTIPDTWELNEVQRSFVDSMIDEQSK